MCLREMLHACGAFASTITQLLYTDDMIANLHPMVASGNVLTLQANGNFEFGVLRVWMSVCPNTMVSTV